MIVLEIEEWRLPLWVPAENKLVVNERRIVMESNE